MPLPTASEPVLYTRLIYRKNGDSGFTRSVTLGDDFLLIRWDEALTAQTWSVQGIDHLNFWAIGIVFAIPSLEMYAQSGGVRNLGQSGLARR
jgi:hypothetical protein